jgi:hypothetical protein
MRNKAILLACLVCTAMAVHAQNSGYLGRKFSLNYNTYFSNALNFPNQFGNSGLLSFNVMHHVEADVVVGRHKTLGLNFEYAKTSFPYSNYLEYRAKDVNGVYTGRMATFRTKDVGKIDVFGCGIYLRHFFKGNIAPLGTYIKPGLNIVFFNADPGDPVSTNGLTLEDAGITLNNYGPYMSFNISMEVGQNRIFFNRMFLDYGLRLGISPTEAIIMSDGIDVTKSGFLGSISRRRVDSMLLFNAKIGVGVLL